MKDRIKELMERQHMSQKTFAEVLNISTGSLSGIFTGRTRPTLNIVEAIRNKFPKINLDWLIFGQGPMYLDESTDNNSVSNVVTSSSIDKQMTSNEQPTLFGSQKISSFDDSVPKTPNNSINTVVKYIDKQERKITEIRIFYDDQTWETFLPKK